MKHTLITALLLVPLASGALDTRLPILIETGKISVRLASPEQGMGVLGVVHKRLRQEMVKAPENPDEALLWKLELTTAPDDDDAFYVLTNRNPNGQRSASFESGQYVLDWLGLDLKEGKGLLDVRVTIQPSGARGLAEWRMEVRNRGKQTGIYRPVFPVLECGVIGASGEDDYLLATAAEGRSICNPILKGGKSKDYWVPEMDGQPATTVSADAIGFGSQRPDGVPYPTARGQMQFAAYYEKPGDFYYPTRDKAGGLYLATHDCAPHPKVFFLTSEKKRNRLTLEVAHYPESQAEKGASYTMPYPVILEGFSGDWYDAATIYRGWAVDQSWTRAGPLHRRDDVPAWIKNAVSMLRIDVKKRPNADALAPTEFLRGKIPGPILAQWYNWASPEKDAALTGYAFPPVADAPPGFRESLQHFREQDIHVFPYINFRLWSSKRAGYAEALKHASRGRHGELHRFGVVKEDEVAGNAYLCDMTAFWQDYLLETCKGMKANFGVEALYLDQLSGGHFGGALKRDGAGEHGGCWDASHGHPLGMNRSFIEAQLNNVRRVVDALSENGEQFPLCGEGSDETLVGLTPVKLIHYELWPGYVPLFGRVYHDYITYYGRTVPLIVESDKADPYPQMGIAWQLICGNQLGRVWSTNGDRLKESAVMRANLAYLQQAATARHEFPHYLCLGELLRPPYLSTVPDITTKAFKVAPHKITLPSVLAGTFRAADGRVALVVTSIHDQPLSFSLGVDFADAGLTADAVDLVRVFPNEEKLGRLSRGGETTLSLKPREIALVELRQ